MKKTLHKNIFDLNRAIDQLPSGSQYRTREEEINREDYYVLITTSKKYNTAPSFTPKKKDPTIEPETNILPTLGKIILFLSMALVLLVTATIFQ